MTARLTLLAGARSSALLDVRFDDDRPLDPEGWRQAQHAARELAHLHAAELRYCSPTRRCRQTGEALGLWPLAQPALRDCDMGRWRGRRLDEVMAVEPDAVNDWLADPKAVPHGGESLLTFVTRIGRWLDTRPMEQGTRVLAVVEPSVVRAALVYALKAPPHCFWRVEAHPLAVVTLTGRPGRWGLCLDGVD